ncbi:hypothetical protein MKW92_038379 [Papaver armeniacum]|nr:hypothetical protein MKW92_038379 [Papaver armeniacum]
MEGKEVSVPRLSPRIIEHTTKALIETLNRTQHNTLNLKRQRRHDLDPHQRAHEQQQRRILGRAKQSSMTIHEREAFLEKRRYQ